MNLGLSTFMDTKKESYKFHKGIFYGIKHGFICHDPRKVPKYSRANHYKLSEFMEYYRRDEHYYDVPYILMYGVSSAVEIGIVAYGVQEAVKLIFWTLPTTI